MNRTNVKTKCFFFSYIMTKLKSYLVNKFGAIKSWLNNKEGGSFIFKVHKTPSKEDGTIINMK